MRGTTVVVVVQQFSFPRQLARVELLFVVHIKLLVALVDY